MSHLKRCQFYLFPQVRLLALFRRLSNRAKDRKYKESAIEPIRRRIAMNQCAVTTATNVLTLFVALVANGAEPLRPIQSISLPKVEGRFDHFAFDAKRGRLFVAALGNNTVEVVDLASGKVAQKIKDLKAPQGIAYAPELDRLAVANDQDGTVKLYDGGLLKEVHVIDLKDDADNVRYDADARQFWVGYGNGALAAIDPQSGKVLATVRLDAHPESFQLETKGKRIFANVAGAAQVAGVDREKATVTAKCRLREAQSNFPRA